MKTSEFIEGIEKLGYEVEDLEGNTPSKSIRIINVKLNNEYVARAFVDDYYKFDIKNVSSSFKKDKGYDLLMLILEYAATNLNEREDEKKYRLMCPEDFNKIRLYVLQDIVGNYIFRAFNFEDYKSEFTQKEIDNMPQSWQKFFIKVEVNES